MNTIWPLEAYGEYQEKCWRCGKLFWGRRDEPLCASCRDKRNDKIQMQDCDFNKPDSFNLRGDGSSKSISTQP